MHGATSPLAKPSMALNRAHGFTGGLVGQFFGALMVSQVDIFIEKPFSVVTLSCIPASHPIVGASQNTLQRLRSNMSTTRKTSDSLARPETEKPPALTLADKARKLVARDRDFDERSLCMVCTNVIRPGGVTTCTKWWVAGMGAQNVRTDIALLLQRCDAFNAFDHGHQSFL